MNMTTYSIQTWNDGAAVAAEKIFDFLQPHPGLTVTEIRLSFTKLEDYFAHHENSGMFSIAWSEVGHIAARYAANSGHGFTKEELTETLIRKQRDYGHENISRFGTYGVIVRCHDKIARLENLTARGAQPQNESIKDNLLDVAGYAAIGIMLNHGWFQLELE